MIFHGTPDIISQHTSEPGQRGCKTAVQHQQLKTKHQDQVKLSASTNASENTVVKAIIANICRPLI